MSPENLEKSSHNSGIGFPENFILRIVGGPAAGREISIKDRKVTLGRAASADIPIPDTVISRVHVSLSYDGEKWMVRDLGSTNGTWVDGEKKNGEVELPLRTPVRIGNTLFEVYKPIEKNDTIALDESLISYRLSPISLDSLSVDVPSEDLKKSLCFYNDAPAEGEIRREQQKLTAIYQLQSLLATVANEHELYHRILELVNDVIPSDSSYLLLYSMDDGALAPVAGRNSEGRIDGVMSQSCISKSIVNYVKRTNEGILSVDAPNDERFLALSLTEFGVQSVICVPMLGKESSCGLIYLSSEKSSRKDYEEEDLKLLTIVAYSAAMAIENKRLVEENIRSERMAAVGITAAGLSHYVKNILNGLEGSVSLLRLGIDSTDKSLMDKAWDILSRNHKRLSSLVLDMLNLAKEDTVDMVMCNVADIVIETAELIEPLAREKGIKIELNEKMRNSKIFVELDSRSIHRVLLNLLNNAIDAVTQRHGESNGGGVIAIRLFLEDHGQTMVLIVKDNGSGIAPENISKVFEMFYTGKGKRGTGLGLAVSKRIVENHRGKISVESVEGSGTSFLVRIPVRHEDSITGFIPSTTNR